MEMCMNTNRLNPAGLERLHTTMLRHLESGDIPSLITLVARGEHLGRFPPPFDRESFQFNVLGFA